MGKGCGCVPSKNRPPAETAAVQDIPEPQTNFPTTNTTTQVQDTAQQVTRKLKIFIIFYSMYGHVELLARRMKKGVDSIDGVEGFLYRVKETLPVKVLDQMRVPQKGDEVPFVSVGEMVNADGFLFGFPTRFGSMAAQMKTFFDSTDELWIEQKLVGVPAGFFVSTGTQGGGQETTAKERIRTSYK